MSRRIVLLIVIALLVAGCGTPEAALEATPGTGTVAPGLDDGPDLPGFDADRGIIGTLTVIDPGTAVDMPVITVEADDPDSRYQMAILTLDQDTRVVRRAGGQDTEVTAGDLMEGDRVAVTFRDDVGDEEPAMAMADEIWVLGDVAP